MLTTPVFGEGRMKAKPSLPLKYMRVYGGVRRLESYPASSQEGKMQAKSSSQPA